MRMRRYAVCAAVLIAFVGLGCVVLPQEQLPDDERQLVALDQGWIGAERAQFYHESQGATMVPYEWFIALEQPQIKFVGSVGLFRDAEYLSRYGLLPGRPIPTGPGDETGFTSPSVTCDFDTDPDADPYGADYNCGLPVGVARTTITVPGTQETEDVVGFTCAGCHTSELHYGDTAIRIEGASNLVDVTQFQAALGGAMLLTQRFPFRFNRFADRVLTTRGVDPDSAAYDDERAKLRDAVSDFMASNAAETTTALRKGLYAGYPGGFGRTDALARITNMVFGTEMNIDDNLVVGSAPVKFPSIWDAPYFSWAQYNGSIEQSMVRNVGEALGVRARVAYLPDGGNWAGEAQSRIESTIDMPGLYSIETLLRGTGTGYFNGLRSPVWPEEHLGPINWERAERGQQLYQNHCQACHLPPTADLVQVGDVTTAAGQPARGLVPAGEPVYQVEGDPTTTVLGLELPVPGAGDGSTGMYWISNNHPSMLSNLAPRPFAQQEFFLEFGTVNLGTIGTDPGQAANFAKNIINTKGILLPQFPIYGPQIYPPGTPRAGELISPMQFPQRIVPAGVGLQMVTLNITTSFYDRVDAQDPNGDERRAFIEDLPANLLLRDARGNVLRDADGHATVAYGLFDESGKINRDEWNGFRAPAAEANAGYRPHSLNGIWASPPYLHNGSLPTIYDLLSPYEERPKTFYTGNREYDPARLGYVSSRLKGAFEYDTTVTGNSNGGHRFEEGPRGRGVIGPYLTPDDRMAIIEFIKTLCPPGTRSDRNAPGGAALCRPLPGLSGGR